MNSTAAPTTHTFDATTDTFETAVLQKSLETPVLVDFWAEWCGPCKQLGPMLEKLVAEYNGAFVLAKVDVDKEQQLAAAFQVRSIPTVFLVQGGQLVDGFPGVIPEGQIREFLKQHGIEPAAPPADEPAVDAGPVDPQAEVLRLRAELAEAPETDTLKLDLALALLMIGATEEAERLIDALPANLATDDRTLRARARLGFITVARDSPPAQELEQALARGPDDLRARYQLAARQILDGQAEHGLEQLIEMLRRDRTFDGGLPRKALIEAFRVVEDPELVGRYRRRMASLLF